MKQTRFPSDNEDLVTEIPSTTHHIQYSHNRDYADTWYQTADYRSFRMDCLKVAKDAQSWKILKVLDGTTSLGSTNSHSNSTVDNLRLQANLCLWSMRCHDCRGLEKVIGRSHSMRRKEQIIRHRDAVLDRQDELLDFHHLPDFVAKKLSTTSIRHSTSSSQLARNMGVADSFFAEHQEEGCRYDQNVSQNNNTALVKMITATITRNTSSNAEDKSPPRFSSHRNDRHKNNRPRRKHQLACYPHGKSSITDPTEVMALSPAA